MLEDSLSDVDFYKDRHQKFTELSAASEKVLECFKDQPEIKLVTQDICKKTRISRRTVIYALNALLEAGFIQAQGRGPSRKYKLIF